MICKSRYTGIRQFMCNYFSCFFLSTINNTTTFFNLKLILKYNLIYIIYKNKCIICNDLLLEWIYLENQDFL